eukprot:4064493-Amphidinium_carterae.2
MPQRSVLLGSKSSCVSTRRKYLASAQVEKVTAEHFLVACGGRPNMTGEVTEPRKKSSPWKPTP